MTRTRQEERQEQRDAYKHLLEEIFGWNEDEAGYKALMAAGYNSITDIVTLDKEEIDDLEYEDNTSGTAVMKKVPTKQKKLLKHALLYYDYQVKLHASKMFDAADW